MAHALSEEWGRPGTEVLLARSFGHLAGIAITLAHHPDPTDPDPWIGLLLVDASLHGQGHGRRLATLVEDRFRAAGRTAVRLAVLDDNPKALAFWTALGYGVVDHREDRQMRPVCGAPQGTHRVLARPQGRSGFPSPYSQSSQIPSKSFPGACFSTYAVKSAVSAVPWRRAAAQPRRMSPNTSSPTA